MKKFIGFYIIGAFNKTEAVNEKGLMLWSQNRPNFMKRFFNKFLLGIYWIDKEKILEKKQDSQKLKEGNQTEMTVYKPFKPKKDEYSNQRRHTDKMLGRAFPAS